MKWCKWSECDDLKVIGCEQDYCWKHHKIICRPDMYDSAGQPHSEKPQPQEGIKCRVK